MDKLIITCQNHVVRTALAREGKILQISLEASQEKSMLNSIYIGRVQNIVKNINAAFVDTSAYGFHLNCNNLQSHPRYPQMPH